MFLESYCNTTDGKISFTRKQASDFAKQVADDFNPIHNEDAKRFCVPGDLLFSIVLENTGLYQEMAFTFSGMVTDGIQLNFPSSIDGSATITDVDDKEYLSIAASGDVSKNKAAINSLIKAYVGFSGHTFPHILVALMKENNVMINPTRPMVMYESMELKIDTFDFTEVSLTLASSELNINGKRGKASLAFDLVADGKVIGHGKKFMVLSGLREYCQDNIDSLVNVYNDSKEIYLTNQ